MYAAAFFLFSRARTYLSVPQCPAERLANYLPTTCHRQPEPGPTATSVHVPDTWRTPRRHIVRCPVSRLNTMHVPSFAIFSMMYAPISSAVGMCGGTLGFAITCPDL